MARREDKQPTLEEEDAITVEEDEISEDDEVFSCTLVGKIWTERPYNARAFKQTIIQAWRSRNPVETQDLNKNLFLFKFATKKEAELVCRNGPWNFDRNLVILDRIASNEQPSEMAMDSTPFRVRVYDLPLKLRSEGIAKKIGNMVGKFLEMDEKECNRMGKFLRIQISIDLKKPLKKGSKIHFQGRDIWVDYKYEKLPNFCFSCGRIRHQMRDCEDIEDQDVDAYSELEEKDQAFGPWLRASPLPKVTYEAKRETSSGCNKNLFSPPSNNNKGKNSGTRKETGEEVEQQKGTDGSRKEGEDEVASKGVKGNFEIEGVAESLGAISISTLSKGVSSETPRKTHKGRN